VSAKVFPYWATLNYRESYGLCASNGVLFNHESPRRGERLSLAKSRVQLQRSRWAAKGIVPRQFGREARLGICTRYVEAMWRILQLGEGDGMSGPQRLTCLVGDGSTTCSRARRQRTPWKTTVGRDGAPRRANIAARCCYRITNGAGLVSAIE
jgi:hypothetical protein